MRFIAWDLWSMRFIAWTSFAHAINRMASDQSDLSHNILECRFVDNKRWPERSTFSWIIHQFRGNGYMKVGSPHFLRDSQQFGRKPMRHTPHWGRINSAPIPLSPISSAYSYEKNSSVLYNSANTGSGKWMKWLINVEYYRLRKTWPLLARSVHFVVLEHPTFATEGNSKKK